MRLSFIRKIKLALIATLAMVLILSFTSLQSLQKLKASHDWIDHTQLVLRKANLLTAKMATVEEYYSYILNGDKAGLVRLAVPVQSIETDLMALKAMVSTNRHHQQQLDTVLKYSRLRNGELLRIEKKIANERLASGSTNLILNPVYRHKIQESIDRMRQAERSQLARQQARTTENGFWTFAITASSMIFAIGIISSLYYFIHKTLKQKQQAERNQRASEANFSNSFNFSGIGQAIVSPAGEWIEINANLCNLLGYSEQEIRGLALRQITHPDDLSQHLAFNEQILDGRINSFSLETRYYHKSGHIIWVLLTVSVIRSSKNQGKYLLKQIVDITETKKITQENQTILDTSIDVICTINSEGRFVSVSRACKSVWGYESEELVGIPLLDLVLEEDRVSTLNTSEAIRAGSPVTNFTNRFHRKDGTIVPIIWSASWSESEQLSYCIARDGSQQDLFETAFKAEKQRFESMFLQAPACIAVLEGPDHIFKVANSRYLRVTGKKDILGKPVREVFSELGEQGFLERLDLVYSTGDMCTGKEMRADIKSHNGAIRELYFDFVYQPYRNSSGKIIGVFVFANDVTQQVTARKKVEESERRYRQLMEEMPGAVYACNTEGYITLYNKAAAALWGREPELGKEKWCGAWKTYKLSDIKEVMTVCPMEETIRSGKPVRDRQMVIEQPSGELRTVTSHPFPLFDSEGEMQGAINMLIDITESQRAELELRKAKNIAEQAALAKSDFLSIMSHEIRTPMNAVIGFTTLLLQDAREDQKESLDMLKYSGDNLLALINDILDFSKIESGKIEFEKADYNLKETVDNVRKLLRAKADDRNIRLNIAFDSSVPEMVSGDPVRLAQILINLVGNAIKFTESGTVSIGITSGAQDDTGTELLFKITDTGIGIPEDKQSHIFDSFTQASSDTTRKYGGTGLGLSICKRLVELQGGEIRLDSTVGEGSTFSFTLKAGKSDMVAVSTGSRTATPARSLAGTRVLLAEDNLINVMVARRFLQQWQIECDVAENGLMALKMVQQRNYDLILMDLHMPEMDGLEATAAIRSLPDEDQRELPIIALTASASEDVKNKVLLSGMDDYITKPFDPEELFNKISAHKKDLMRI